MFPYVSGTKALISLNCVIENVCEGPWEKKEYHKHTYTQTHT